MPRREAQVNRHHQGHNGARRMDLLLVATTTRQWGAVLGQADAVSHMFVLFAGHLAMGSIRVILRLVT